MDEKEAEARPLMGTIFLVYIICIAIELLEGYGAPSNACMDNLSHLSRA